MKALLLATVATLIFIAPARADSQKLWWCVLRVAEPFLTLREYRSAWHYDDWRVKPVKGRFHGGRLHVIERNKPWNDQYRTHTGELVVSPERAIALLGEARAAKIGIKRLGKDKKRYLFSDADALNAVSAALNVSALEPLFILKLYEGKPMPRELLAKFVEKLEWPFSSNGEIILHDRSVHSLTIFLDNALIRQLWLQMRAIHGFIRFVERHPERFPLAQTDGTNAKAYLEQLANAAARYLDNLMAAVNLVERNEDGTQNAVFGLYSSDASLTAGELLIHLSKTSHRGGGEDYRASNYEYDRAIASFMRENGHLLAEERYELTPDRVKAAAQEKMRLIDKLPTPTLPD